MILLDYNQVFLANIFAQGKNNIDENLVRHTVLSCTLSYKRNYGKEFGEIVFCADGPNCWRKKEYKYYKANRKKNREKGTIDWHPIFSSLNKIREEIKENLPYKLVVVDTAEADDVISVLVRNVDEPTLILSGDQDFIQLHVYPHVKQYAPIQKKYVRHNDPKMYLKEKILRGDRGDGVPNVLSDDDCFVDPNKRQRPLREDKLNSLITVDVSSFPEELQRNYRRNEKLVDLINFIPAKVEEDILRDFESQNPTRKKMMHYFMQNGLRILLEDLTDF